MDFCKMLQPIRCNCGMVHSCDIKQVLIGPGVLGELEHVIGSYNHILLVADQNTYQICGRQVEAQLKERLESTLVYQREGVLVPNEEAIQEMQKQLTKHTDLIIGVGSGVIQDLCKYVSFEAGLPYDIIATAPSMDGYASKGAAMIIGNMKITYTAHVPEVIIGDVYILKDAPMDMIRSGYGDILGKYSCLNDWKLSKVILDEYFCDYVYELTYEMLLKTRNLGNQLQKRDPEAIQTLMEALVGVGIAMAYVGNSRPASGSEHHMSHFFEVTGIMNEEAYLMHGIDVVYSAIYTQKLREALLQIETPTAAIRLSGADWENKIREIYTEAADGVIALQRKLGWYERDLQPIYEEKWEEIREVLREVPSSRCLTEYVESVGLHLSEFEALYGTEKIQDAILYAKDLKDRFTVLWVYYDVESMRTKA